MEGLIKWMENIHSDVKSDIKAATNQPCEKSFKEYIRSIDLHDMALKNIEVLLRQLSQAVQEINNIAFQRVEKWSCRKKKEQYLPISAHPIK